MMIGHQDRRRSRGRRALARAVVGEHSGRRRRRGASRAGASGKENVGMSNDKISEKLIRRKTKVSSAMLIS